MRSHQSVAFLEAVQLLELPTGTDGIVTARME
jgi:hypothetical protein